MTTATEIKPTNIILVDDHKIVRDGIRLYLEDQEGKFQIVGEGDSGMAAIELVRNTDYDVLIIDINMPGMDGIEAASKIIEEFPGAKIIALTMLSESLHIKQMLQAGASGYLLKNCSEEEVRMAVETVNAGGTYYSQEVTQTIMKNLQKNGTEKSPASKFTLETPLTQREQEVLELIIEECTNQEIADQLFISPRTVDAHKRNLLEKTGAKNVAGLVLYAMNKGMI